MRARLALDGLIISFANFEEVFAIKFGYFEELGTMECGVIYVARIV